MLLPNLCSNKMNRNFGFPDRSGNVSAGRRDHRSHSPQEAQEAIWVVP